MKIDNYFKIAKKTSKLSDHHTHRLGALIISKDRKLLSKGFNRLSKGHPFMGHLKTTHAELAALLKIRNKDCLKGATMVVYRENKAGVMSNSKPCLHCQNILKQHGVKTILYTIDGGYAKEIL